MLLVVSFFMFVVIFRPAINLLYGSAGSRLFLFERIASPHRWIKVRGSNTVGLAEDHLSSAVSYHHDRNRLSTNCTDLEISSQLQLDGFHTNKIAGCRVVNSEDVAAFNSLLSKVIHVGSMVLEA